MVAPTPGSSSAAPSRRGLAGVGSATPATASTDLRGQLQFNQPSTGWGFTPCFNYARLSRSISLH